MKKRGCGRLGLCCKLGCSQDILLEEMREIMKNLFGGRLCPGRD